MRPLPTTNVTIRTSNRPSILKKKRKPFALISRDYLDSSPPSASDQEQEQEYSDEEGDINDDSGFYQQKVEEGEDNDYFPLPGFENFNRQRRRSHSNSLLDPVLVDWTVEFNQVTESTHKSKLTSEYQYQNSLESLFLERSSEILNGLAQTDRAKAQLNQFEQTKEKTNKVLKEKRQILLNRINSSSSSSSNDIFGGVNNAARNDDPQLERQKTIQQLLSKLVSISSILSQQKQSTLEKLSKIDNELQRSLDQEERKYEIETKKIRDNYHSWVKGNGIITTSSTSTSSSNTRSKSKGKGKGKTSTGLTKTKKTISNTTSSKGKKKRASTGTITTGGKRKSRRETLTSGEEEGDSSADDDDGKGIAVRRKRRKTG
ncbi:hypothetical protein JCM5350_001091 [Sporobolomyces pararoseus]